MSEYKTTDELLDDSRSLREIVQLREHYETFMDSLIEEQKASPYRRTLLLATLDELGTAFQSLADITNQTVVALKLVDGESANV